MLALTIASYTEKNMNFKIGVQGAMLIDTNEMIIVRWLRMSPTKRAKKRQGQKRKNVIPDQDIEGSQERKSSCSCDVVPTCDRPLEAYVLKPKGY
jgi:hypothetical protein